MNPGSYFPFCGLVRLRSLSASDALCRKPIKPLGRIGRMLCSAMPMECREETGPSDPSSA